MEGAAQRGSQHWLQIAVNQRHDVIDNAIVDALKLPSSESINWLSPLKDDTPPFKEYMDKEFLERLCINLEHTPLKDFWPRSGPRWDGLARIGDRHILIEAKANLPEFNSGGSKASPRSLAKIQSALKETKEFLHVSDETDWTTCFYQYANRLAHLYLLKELNKVPTALVFVYFVGDDTVPGRDPVSREKWEAAIELAHHHLGVRPNSPWMKQNVFDVFIDVHELNDIQ